MNSVLYTRFGSLCYVSFGLSAPSRQASSSSLVQGTVRRCERHCLESNVPNEPTPGAWAPETGLVGPTIPKRDLIAWVLIVLSSPYWSGYPPELASWPLLS